MPLGYLLYGTVDSSVDGVEIIRLAKIYTEYHIAPLKVKRLVWGQS